MSRSPEAIAEKLSRKAKPTARLTAVSDTPFGGELRVQGYRFGNGLRVEVLVDRSAPVVSYQTWLGVGSRHERVGKTGLAHLFEHLMFKETKHYGPGELDRMLEAAGAEMNAATWTDWTHYYENVPKAAFPLAVELEADRMENLVLRAPQVASEKEVVMNERRMRVDDDVEGATNEVLYARAFTKHPYRWPTIGWMKDIESFTVRDCLAFYRTYYAPNNATLVVAGDVDEEDALRLVQRAYGHMRASRIPSPRRVREPDQTRERRERLPQPTPTEKLCIGWRAPAHGEREHAVLVVLNEILTGGRSSRLYGKLVTELELASSVAASAAPFRDPGLFELWADARTAVPGKKLLAEIDRELVRLRRELVRPEEIEKAQNRLELGWTSAMETASGKAEQIGFSATVSGDVGSVFRRLAEYREVRPEDVRAVARRYLAPSRRTVIHVVPHEESAS